MICKENNSLPHFQNFLAPSQPTCSVAQERSVVYHGNSTVFERPHARLHLLGAQIAPATVDDEVCVDVRHLVVLSEAVDDVYLVFVEQLLQFLRDLTRADVFAVLRDSVVLARLRHQNFELAAAVLALFDGAVECAERVDGVFE